MESVAFLLSLPLYKERKLQKTNKLLFKSVSLPRLQDVREEECPGECHVVEVQKGGPVGEDGVDVDLLDVGQVGDGVGRHLEVAHVLDGAVVLVHQVHLGLDLVEGVARVPHLENESGDVHGFAFLVEIFNGFQFLFFRCLCKKYIFGDLISRVQLRLQIFRLERDEAE